MVTDSDEKAETPRPPKVKPVTTYPGKNDGSISASKHAGMRTGASRPAPMKK